MPRMAYETIPAPLGMDVSGDPVLMAPQRAQWMQNLRVAGPGSLAGIGFTTIPRVFPNPIDGMAWYFGVGGENDRLLVLTGGALWSARTVQPETTPPAFTDWVMVGSGFQSGKALRSVQFNDEMILVQEDGLEPKRFDGATVYKLGIDRPPAPTVVVNPPTSGTGNKRGRITYKQSYADARLRESSLSDGTTIDFTTAGNSGKAAFLPVNFPADPQVRVVYTYANLAGGSVWYRIATTTRNGDVVEDNLADNSVSTGTVGPSAGQNDPPLAASCVAVHKNRVWMNAVEQPGTLQVSNAGSITQWAAVNNTDADGIRLTVTSDQADNIAAVTSFGSLLAVYKRQRIYQVFGDTPASFRIVEIHQRGTTAPMSVTRCDNVICTLLDAAVYAAAYNDGFLLTKISEQLDSLLEPMQRSQAGRRALSRAEGQFAENRYYLAVDAAVFVYDFDTGEWTVLGGSDVSAFRELLGQGGDAVFRAAAGGGGAANGFGAQPVAGSGV